VWVAVQARRQRTYVPVLSDWISHVALPLVAWDSAAYIAARGRSARSLPVQGLADDGYQYFARVGTTHLTPPLGSSTSPAYLGIRCT
jgi:hypothetical protein